MFSKFLHFHLLADLGIPWVQILTWLETYGFPLVIKLLALLIPLLGQNHTAQQVIDWLQAALDADRNGQKPPPFPLPEAST